MTITVPDEKHTALIAGLRELADWLEQHPDAPVRFTSILNSLDADGLATFAAAAEVEAKPKTVPGEPRPYSHDVDLRFGPLTLNTYTLDRDLYEERVARSREVEKTAVAAHWVFVCADENVQSAGYATERETLTQLDVHREACNGGSHQFKLVPAELVQA